MTPPILDEMLPLLKIHPPADFHSMVGVHVLHVVPSLIAHHSVLTGHWTLVCILCDMWDVAMIGSCVLLSLGPGPMWRDQARRRSEKTGADGDICDGGVMV